MYKHLTPQEIEEFEKLYVSWIVYEPKFSGEMLGEAGLKLKKDALSFIDTLMGKRVGEERERIEDVFRTAVPPHALSLEDGVWLKRLLNKAFNHRTTDEYKTRFGKKILSKLEPPSPSSASPKRNEEDL